MIHAYAIEPDVAVAWSDKSEFRLIFDKFGLGTPRVLLELPKFTKWKRAVYDIANRKGLSGEDEIRLAEIFRIIGEQRVRRSSLVYDGNIPWLENAETEYDRRLYAAIIAMTNPHNHEAVIIQKNLG